MKNKSLFWMVSVGLLIGTAVAYIINREKNYVKSNKDVALNKKDSDDNLFEDIKRHGGGDLEVIKIRSAYSISDRHKEAMQIVKNSMEKINNVNNLSSKHEDEFDSILEELDMLSE